LKKNLAPSIFAPQVCHDSDMADCGEEKVLSPYKSNIELLFMP